MGTIGFAVEQGRERSEGSISGQYCHYFFSHGNGGDVLIRYFNPSTGKSRKSEKCVWPMGREKYGDAVQYFRGAAEPP
jgi:hypothetical protein